MHRSLGDNVCVEAVAEVDRVDVITITSQLSSQYIWTPSRRTLRQEWSQGIEGNSPLEITVHDGEEHLQEQVDGIDNDRQQV